MTWTFHHKSVTTSTNADAHGAAAGHVFTADLQTAGRGRLDHVWQSPAGENLTFSAVLDVAELDPLHTATLPLVAGLAVADALEPVLAGCALALKWPNDVWVDGRKIAGILCERAGDTVIVGIGVNVRQTRFPPALAVRATSLAAHGVDRSPHDVLHGILSALDRLLPIWRTQGFAALHDRFASRDCLKGRNVSVFRTDADREPLTGLCTGVQPDGTLCVAGESVFAGEAHIHAFDTPTSVRAQGR